MANARRGRNPARRRGHRILKQARRLPTHRSGPVHLGLLGLQPTGSIGTRHLGRCPRLRCRWPTEGIRARAPSTKHISLFRSLLRLSADMRRFRTTALPPRPIPVIVWISSLDDHRCPPLRIFFAGHRRGRSPCGFAPSGSPSLRISMSFLAKSCSVEFLCCYPTL